VNYRNHRSHRQRQEYARDAFQRTFKADKRQDSAGRKGYLESPKEIKKFRFKVGIAFQYPEYQLFEETVYKDIAFGPKNMELSEEEIDKRVRSAAAFCGLDDDILKKSPFELSGGQKRRAAIAGVIAMEPQVLVLDEPAAGLDPLGREEILGGLIEYQKQRGSLMLLISHSMEDIANTATEFLYSKAAAYTCTER
jgi:energy-coupling factor transport system ATP-binding protein